MLRRRTIASKIFGLSLLLLAFMVVLSVVNTMRVRAIEQQLKGLMQIGQPLSETVAAIDMSGARRRIAFERLCRGYASPIDGYRSEGEALANHALFARQADSLITVAEGILTHANADLATDASVLAEMRTDLATLRTDLHAVGEMQQKILAAYRSGDTLHLAEQESAHAQRQIRFQTARAHLRDLTAGLAAGMSLRISEAHQLVVITSFALTAVALVLGLLVAWGLTSRMVRPVRELMAGIGRVEQGDLNVRLPITSQDEIGELTGSFNRMVHELEGKQRLKDTFGRYMDPRLIEQLVATHSGDKSHGDRQEMTVAFADLVGYTTLSTQLDPDTMVRLLNAHFTAAAEVLHQHHGVVDKFIGDAVMAYWGAPFVEEERHAIEACLAALAQVRRFDRFITEDLPAILGKGAPIPPVGLCIGVATGEMIVGNIGSERAMSWTVIGDAVNLAARLEGLNRKHGTRILVSQRTCELASSVIRFREVGDVEVKGYERTVKVFEPIGLVDEATTEANTI